MSRLNTYLADINKQAQERFERLVEDMKRVQNITEKLKDENALEWLQRMNNIRMCTMEIISEEIIYTYTTWRQSVKALSSLFSKNF